MRIHLLSPLTCAALAFTTWVTTAPAALIFSSTFESATGTTDGSAISGTVGGTATIRDTGGSLSGAQVITTPEFGAGGFLRVNSAGAEGANFALGARFTPLSPAESLGAMFSNAGGINALNGGIDFFFRTDTAVTSSSGGDALRFLDAAAPTGGLRLTLTSAGLNTYRVEVIRQTGGNNILATNALSFAANTIYHMGLTFSTDPTGLTTAKLFGREGLGAIDTAATTLAEGFVGSMTFNLDETAVTTGFTTGAYDFGKLRANTNANFVQDFDSFRLYDSVPAEFAAIPEPATAAVLFAGLGILTACSRRRAGV